MQRYYQGQLDFFCAIYAVINALTALYSLTLAQARVLLASMLSDVSKQPDIWRATLENKTDFHWLAEHMLLACGKGASYPVKVFRPFSAMRDIPESAADLREAKPYADIGLAEDFQGSGPERAEIIWSKLEDWLDYSDEQPQSGTVWRVAVLRFHRYIQYLEAPVVSHWSVADRRSNGLICLRDASKEENAIYSFTKSATAFSKEDVSASRTVRIEPESVFFVERR